MQRPAEDRRGGDRAGHFPWHRAMIDDDAQRIVRALLSSRTVAALATLHRGLPAASMVPFALHDAAVGEGSDSGTSPTTGGGRVILVTHVSRLSAHTRDMLDSPAVCLLVTGPDPADGGGGMPQAVPRIAIQAEARFVPREMAGYTALHDTYVGRFPDTAAFFGFADFSLVALIPTGARLVAGFARAHSLSPAELDRAAFGP